MASISENIKEGKIVSFRIRTCLGRNREGKQIFAQTTWHIPEGMKLTTATKKVKKFAEAWEYDQKEQYLNSADAASEECISFTSFVKETWIPLMLDGSDRKTKTIDTYKYLANKACDYFQEKDLKSITPLDLQRYIHYLQIDTNNKNAKPLAKKTIRHHYCVLSMIFRFAFDNEIIDKNPMTKVKAPNLERKKVDAFSIEEAKKFLFFLQECDLEFQCMMLFMLTLGLRRSEVCGLQFNDIDLQHGIVTINRGVTVAPGARIVVDVPKTESSLRVLPIPRMLLEVLRDYLNVQRQERKGNDYLFSGESNSQTPRDPDAVTRRVKRFMERAGLPDMSPHDLRHSCATLLLQSGADIKSVQEIMGHADPSTTLRYYVRTDIDQMRQATNIMESLLDIDDDIKMFYYYV